MIRIGITPPIFSIFTRSTFIRSTESTELDYAALLLPGDTVIVGQGSAEPITLSKLLVEQRNSFESLKVFLGISLSDVFRPEHADRIAFSSWCASGTNRRLVKAGVLDILPIRYSDIPAYISSNRLPADVVLLQLAPADGLGRYSLSLQYDYIVAALKKARLVIAEVNEQAPWTCGSHFLNEDDIDIVVPTSRALLESHNRPPQQVEAAIAQHIVGMVEDGTTIQLGIGSLPDTIVAALRHKRDLGLHSGVLTDSVVDLIEIGAINNSRKSIDKGISIASVALGSSRLHKFLHNNASIHFRPCDYTHSPSVLSRLDNFSSLNSAIEVDLTGQINSEVADGVYVGTVGGLLDFQRAALNSKGGLPIVALPSMAKGRSRVVSQLNGPVTIPRSDAGIVVTEYGVADLRGQSLEERTRRMVSVAHPSTRESLAREAHVQSTRRT